MRIPDLSQAMEELLDASIFFSFDLSGFKRHAKKFQDELIYDKNKTALITGGTSGIGLAAALSLSSHGIETTILGRSEKTGIESASLNAHLHFKALDMSDWDGVIAFCDSAPEYDFIVLNAGGMPENFETNKYGVESQMASQLFGHYYLIKKLQELGKLKTNSRIVWVTSGGMYLKALTLAKIFKDGNYDKVGTYANVKRAQVTMLDDLKKEFSEHFIAAMHPGWVDTPGVKATIPGFYEKMQGRLRAPDQGADTILWLLLSQKKLESGELYFDRMKVRKHLFWFTKLSARNARELGETLLQYFQKVQKS